MNNPNMKVDVCGVLFNNPVIAASGSFGFGLDYTDYVDLNEIGGISVKGFFNYPKLGNPPPRIAETPSGILNSVGLQSPGVEVFLNEYLPKLKQYDTKIIANVNGNTIEDYCKLTKRLQNTDIDMIELNISCPNVKEGGLAFGAKPEMVYQITKEVKPYADKPFIVKLSPNTMDIKETALAAEEAGADGLSLINTLLGMAIDVDKRKPILGNIIGGLSGPAIMPVALRMVWQVANTVKIPIIGMGGIMTGEDAAAFLLAGAKAVGVGSANLATPEAMVTIIAQLKEYLIRHNESDVNDIIGALKC